MGISFNTKNKKRKSSFTQDLPPPPKDITKIDDNNNREAYTPNNESINYPDKYNNNPEYKKLEKEKKK